MSDNEFEKEQQTGSHTYPSAAGDLGKGDYIVIDGKPCKIVETSTSKTGKHGHAKSKITAIDIFTGNKVEDVLPSSHNVDCPFVVKNEVELVSIDHNGFVTFLTEEGKYREDLKLPKESEADFLDKLKEDHKKGCNILLTIICALGHEQFVSYREDKK